MTEKEQKEKDLKTLLYYRDQNKLLAEQVEFYKNHFLITKYTALRYKYIGLIAQSTNDNKSTSTEEVRRPEPTSDTK